jgi:hypothetical protein
VGFSGFCVGGIDWPRPELEGVTDPARRAEITRTLAREEARLVHSMGGNMLRLFYAVGSLLGPVDDGVESVFPRTLYPISRTAISVPLSDRVDRLDRCLEVLDDAHAALRGEPASLELDLSALDAYLDGVGDFNRDAADGEVRVLLSLVSMASRWIVEAPSAATLARHGRSYTQASLWRQYLDAHAELHRLLARRYLAGSAPVVCAFEVANEPDYCWIPAEMKIEGGHEGPVWPLWKYVTELHLAQVPERDGAPAPYEATAWGYQDQDAGWDPGRVTPILEFDWGAKFDWYVKSFAELQAAIATALRDEAAAQRAPVEIVSGSVTHNNIDYLLRMARAVPGAFDAITKVGIHPYHWVGNDVWDDRFVSEAPTGGWRAASPREYAASYFKRFDFLSEIAACTAPSRRRRRGPAPPPELARAVAGKALWITEFGIGTKVLGAFNAPVAEFTRFIRPRAGVGLAGGHDTAVCEDLWEAFLDQVDASWLQDHRVECLLVYALREAGVPRLDMDDDDRSNLAVFARDGSPRLDPPTVGRLRGLMSAVSGRDRTVAPQPPPRPGLELHRRPWRAEPAEDGPLSMLSGEERALLRWLTAHSFTGAGAIVDGGCFVGGSTIALARGLEASPARTPDTRIDVFDRFKVEPYMTDFYFAGEGLHAGDSFRPIFDRNTAAFAHLLDVHEGDLADHGWDGRPIEILFVDVAKSWNLNDLIVRDFFPHLIPDRSVVVQQDLVFALGHWLPITMEHLAEYFEPVAFAEYNTVVYVCRQAVPAGLPPVSQLAASEKVDLMDRAIARFRGYPRGYLELARCMLLAELGDAARAAAALAEVRRDHEGDALVAQALETVLGVGGLAALQTTTTT